MQTVQLGTIIQINQIMIIIIIWFTHKHKHKHKHWKPESIRIYRAIN